MFQSEGDEASPALILPQERAICSAGWPGLRRMCRAFRLSCIVAAAGWLAAALLACIAMPPALAQQQPATAADLASMTRAAEAGDVAAMATLGDVYRLGQGAPANLDAAIGWYEKADRGEDAYSSFWLGFTLKLRQGPGDLDAALAAFRRAQPAYERALGRDDPELAILHNHIGMAQELLGDYRAALKSYGRSLAIREKAYGADHPDTAGMRVNIANVAQEMGRYDEAEADYLRALDVYRRTQGEESANVAVVLANLGALKRKTELFAQAFALYDEALRIRRLIGSEPEAIADVLYNICYVDMDLELAAEALESCDQAMATYVQVLPPGHPKLATVAGMRAGALERLGRLDEAVADSRAAASIFEAAFGPDHAYTLEARANLSIVLTTARQFEEALSLGRRTLADYARKTGPGSEEVARIANNLAALEIARNDGDAAFDMLMTALPIRLRPDAQESGLGTAIATLSRVLQGSGHPAGGRLFAKLMINTLQATREAVGEGSHEAETFDREMESRFRFLTDQLTADGAFAEAQFVSGLVKQREYSAFTRGAATPEISLRRVRLLPSEEKLLASFRALLVPSQKILDRIDKERAKAESPARDRRLADLDTDLAAAHARLVADAATLFGDFEDARRAGQAERVAQNERYASEAQAGLKALGSDAALYQAVATDETLHLFVSAAGRDTVHRAIALPRATLAEQVFAAVTAVEARAPDADTALAGLYDLLIRPVADDLAATGASVLMLDLSGFLRYVPYAALKGDRGYLIEDYALALATPAVALHGSDRPADDRSGAGFAVAAAHPGFPPLPGAARELESIFSGADGIGPLQGLPHVDAAFDGQSLEVALANKPRFVHIASHFAFQPGEEDRSYLLLGTGEGLDLATLRADPALTFTGVDLLVLSACETARGGGSEGEEIESFGALAQQNGAAAVMATLWRIADDSTASLMTDFYSGLVAGRLDKARALQAAQVAMLRGPAQTPADSGDRSAVSLNRAETAAPTSHPYHWSPFILMGNWR